MRTGKVKPDFEKVYNSNFDGHLSDLLADKPVNKYQLLIQAVRNNICNADCNDIIFDSGQCPHYEYCQGMKTCT